jgi:ribosomal protein S18 acetylase RimI-like enzyme
MIQYSLGGLFMIKEVKNVEDANKCDELLTKLILDERKYNDLIDDNIVIKNHFSKMLDDEDVILLAYYLDKLIVGYILIRKINENLCLLDGLYVLEEYRNQKIASSLLNEAIDRCKKLNVKYIDINVMEKNELAKRIYKKLDFTEYEVKLRKNIVNS